MEDAVERGPSPVLARQGEDGPQVVKGDVALAEGALQPCFLEGGPLFLQSPGSPQVSLREDRPGQGETRLSAFVTANQGKRHRPLVADNRIRGTLSRLEVGII